MNKYLIKAITRSGSITNKITADSLQQAKDIMEKTMFDAGHGKLEVMEVKERYTASIEVHSRH